MLDRVSDALVDYSKALDLASDQAEYWVNRGLAFESLADELLATRENDAAQFYEASVGGCGYVCLHTRVGIGGGCMYISRRFFHAHTHSYM